MAALRAAAIVLAPAAGMLAAPAGATAAKLVGGRQQAAIVRAFAAQRTHRHQAIVSIRVSTVSPSWSLVRSVTPARAGATGSHRAPIALSSSYYQQVGGSERPGQPPRAVKADLDRSFPVTVVYTGSGGESIAYDQSGASTCAGAGDFTDDQTVSVAPMSWSVRFTVYPDQLLAAIRGGGQTVLVPEISFDRAASGLDAVETDTRTFADAGCNQRPTRRTCTSTWRLGGPDPAGQLSIPAGSGLQVGIPMAAATRGSCDAGDYTLGPSLWDGGATTALVRQLGLVGGRLPANPYAPVAVSWPRASAQRAVGFATGPCEGAGPACHDTFHWHATVTLQSGAGA
jgi:hypothetical protein